jgi:chitinase
MRAPLHRLAVACAALALCGARAPAIMAYHDSWRERATEDPTQTTLAATPAYVDVLALAFVRPDLAAADRGLAATGLDYRMDAPTLREAIALLKRRSPQTRVLLSVGGSAYRAWNRLNVPALAALVRSLGADGLDIDYETDDPGCARGPSGQIHCRVASAYVADVRRLRAALPRPYRLSVSAVSTGAYGEGAFHDAKPRGGRYVGCMLDLFRSPEAADVDQVVIQAYDAGPSFDPLQAFAAYRAVWKGPLLLGVEVRLQGSDGPNPDAAETEAIAHALKRDGAAGMMVYPMLEQPAGATVSPTHPNGIMLLQAACRGLGRKACGAS